MGFHYLPNSLPHSNPSVGSEDDSEGEVMATSSTRQPPHASIPEGSGMAIPSPSDFTSSTLRSLAARAQQPQPSGGSLGPDAVPSEGVEGRGSSGEFRSAALRGLAEQTKHTVDQQSKFSRGEGPGAAQRQPQAGSEGLGGGRPGSGFPFGDILGALGGEGGGGGGEMGFMVDFIMQNLLSKEVLYGPLKV